MPDCFTAQEWAYLAIFLAIEIFALCIVLHNEHETQREESQRFQRLYKRWNRRRGTVYDV